MTEFSGDSELANYVRGLGALRDEYHDQRYPQMWETTDEENVGLDLLGPYRQELCEATNRAVARAVDLAVRAANGLYAWHAETDRTDSLNKKLAKLVGAGGKNAQDVLDAAKALAEQATGEPTRLLNMVSEDASNALKAAIAFRNHIGEILGIEITDQGVGADPAPNALHTEVTETVSAQSRLLEAIDTYVGNAIGGSQ